MRRYVCNITVTTTDGRITWATQGFRAWPSKRHTAASRIAREYDTEWAHAEVTSIEEA